MNNKSRKGLRASLTFLMIANIIQLIYSVGFFVLNMVKPGSGSFSISFHFEVEYLMYLVPVAWSIVGIIFTKIAFKAANKQIYGVGSALNMVMLPIVILFSLYFLAFYLETYTLSGSEGIMYYFILLIVFTVLFILLTISNKSKSRGFMRFSLFLSWVSFLVFSIYNVFSLKHFMEVQAYYDFVLTYIPFINGVIFEIICIILYISSFVLFASTDKKCCEDNLAIDYMIIASAIVAYEKKYISEKSLKDTLDLYPSKDVESIKEKLKIPEFRDAAENMVEYPEFKKKLLEHSKNESSKTISPSSEEEEILEILNRNSNND